MINKRCMTFLIVAFIMSFVLATTGYGAVFNVINPVEFQDALNIAASNRQNDTINVAAGTYNITTTLTYNATENYALTVIGAGAGSTFLDGGSSVQILKIYFTGFVYSDPAHIYISGITFKNGKESSDRGGGLNISTRDANITLQDSEFSNNSAYWTGGGVYVSLKTIATRGQ